MAEKVVRGKIISSDGKVLAQTLTENGSEIRDYPYGRMFAHVVGYNDKGKSGLESVCNFDLLKSDANLMTQIKVLEYFAGTRKELPYGEYTTGQWSSARSWR